MSSRDKVHLNRWMLFSGVVMSLFLPFLTGCEDEAVKRDYPMVRTLEVTSISDAGAVFNAEIYEPGGVEITEHGFTWDLSNPQIDKDNRVYLGAFTGTGRFSSEINTGLQKGLTYKVTAFLKAGDYTVYGNTVEFNSLGSRGPVITGFSPDTVSCGDTVTITGSNFSWVSSYNQVRFNEISVYVCNPVSDTVLKVVVPYELSSSENLISVAISGIGTTFTSRKLIVKLPEVFSAVPEQAFWGDTVTVFLKNIPDGVNPRLSLGELRVTAIEPFDGEKMKFVVPDSLQITSNKIIITIPYQIISSKFSFLLLPPVIDSITPLSGNWTSVVTLYGHFNKILAGTEVKFANLAAAILSLTRDSVKVKVPGALTAPANVTYAFGSLQCTSERQFSFLPPELFTVTPKSDYAGGIVTIKGNNFSPGNTSVKFNELSGKIISVTNSEVRCYVPGGYNGNSVLTLTAGVQTVSCPDPFLLTNPLVTSFSPSEGTPGDTITFVCKDLTSSAYISITTQTGRYDLKNVSVVGNLVRAVIPSSNPVSGYPGAAVTRNSITSIISTGELLSITRPEINSFFPLNGTGGNEVTVLGSNFSAVAAYNSVYVNGVKAVITYSSRNEIRFIVPAIAYSGDFPIVVSVGGINVTASGKFAYKWPWSKLPNLPFTCTYATVMKFGDEVIIAHGSTLSKSLYRFDPASQTVTSYNDHIYYMPFIWPSAIVKGNQAYLFGLNEGVANFYLFDYASLSLKKVSDYPGKVFGDHIFMDGDSVLYIGGGFTKSSNTYNKEFWKFSLRSQVWTRLNDLPGNTCHTNEFTVIGRNYAVFTDGSTFEYDPVTDTWSPRARYPGRWSRFKVDAECGGLVYMGYGDVSSENTLKRYNPLTDNWTDLGSTINRTNFYFYFSLDDKLYIGGGYNQVDMWMYEPGYIY